MNNHFGVFNDVPGIEEVDLGQLSYVWHPPSYMYGHQQSYDVVHHPGLDTKTPYHSHHGLPLKAPYSGEMVFTPASYDHTFHGYSNFTKTGLPTPIDTPTPFSYDDNDTDSTTSRSQMCSIAHPEDLATREHGFAHAHGDDAMQWNIGHRSTAVHSPSSPDTPTADFVALNQVYPEGELDTPMLVEHCNGGETVVPFQTPIPHPYSWSERDSPPESHSSPASADDNDDDNDSFVSDNNEEAVDDDDDPSYNPSRSAKPKRKSTGKQPRARRQSAHRRSSSGGVSTPRAGSDRGFPCPFAPYGCEGKFGSKNEWKRHVATQHVKLGFWRCELCPQNSSGPNDFNRKDLFTQHLKRMHRKHLVEEYDPKKKEQYKDIEKIPDRELSEATEPLVKQCLLQLRQAPNKCQCLFCENNFKGAQAWERRMEHLAIHLERFRKAGSKLPPVHEWRHDKELEELLQQEGLIERDTKGKWQLGDGAPVSNERR
jgi:hypothetical protein